VEYVGGVISRYKAGQQVTADEAAKVLAAAQQLGVARAENDASDASMERGGCTHERRGSGEVTVHE